MKESELIKIKKETESLKKVVQHLYVENQKLIDLSYGTIELLKEFSEYKEAVEKLKSQVVVSDNPHADKIAQNAEGSNTDPLEGKSLGELFKLKAEMSK